MTQSMLAAVARKRVAGGGFVPTDIAGCVLWLDASQIVGLSDGDPVDTWNDESGQGNDCSGSGGTRPTYETNVLNGLPVIRFTAASTMFLQGAMSLAGDDATFIAVAAITSSSAAFGRVLSVGDNATDDYTSAAYAAAICKNNTNESIVSVRAFSNLGSVAITHSQAFQASAIFDGTDEHTRVDGGSPATVGSTGTFAVTAYRVGRNLGGDGSLDGDIAEVIVYDSALGTTDRQTVEAYLAAKWGL